MYLQSLWFRPLGATFAIDIDRSCVNHGKLDGGLWGYWLARLVGVLFFGTTCVFHCCILHVVTPYIEKVSLTQPLYDRSILQHDLNSSLALVFNTPRAIRIGNCTAWHRAAWSDKPCLFLPMKDHPGERSKNNEIIVEKRKGWERTKREGKSLAIFTANTRTMLPEIEINKKGQGGVVYTIHYCGGPSHCCLTLWQNCMPDHSMLFPRTFVNSRVLIAIVQKGLLSLFLWRPLSFSSGTFL